MHAPAQVQSRWLANPVLLWGAGIIAATLAGVGVFEALGISVFSRIGLPHEFCYVQQPKLVWLHVVSDALIGAAYVSISATLGYLVFRASRGIPFHWVFLAFGLFIVSCGLTHFMEVWVIWEPVYWLSGYVKVVTAAASVATAVALFGLVPKVFRLVESARQSEQRRIEIEQLNQELERFNYSVAHDLRGPLRGISGFSQMLREDCKHELSADAVRYIDRVQSSVARMDALISDLLKYATVGRQELVLTDVSLEAVLRSSLALLDAQVREKDAEIRIAAPLPNVVGDPTLLQVVFQNLIGNSLKFVAPGVRPQVDITAEVHGSRVTVRVTDNGIGIPPEVRHRVFGMFERFHPNTPGTGIGLPIVHRAVERLQGAIGIETAPGGRGTQFWIRLPAVAPA